MPHTVSIVVRAHVLLDDVRAQYAVILKARRKATPQFGMAAQLIGSIDDHGVRLTALADATVVTSAMAVEAAINFLGVAFLGEQFHRAHLERMGLVPKLAASLAAIEQIALAKGAEILVLLRRISERRNSLVHPKPKELDTPEKAERLEFSDPFDLAADAVQDMERFLELLPQHSRRMAPFLLR